MQTARLRKRAADKASPLDRASLGGERTPSDSSVSPSSSGGSVTSVPFNDDASTDRKGEPVVSRREVKESPEKDMTETWWQIGLQVFFPYIVAGLGMVGAGVVLNIVKQWKVFVEVSEIVILVPALLGLKGNLEMTLASRLSTQANLGNMDLTSAQASMAGGNLALTQVQAVVVGFLSSVFAIFLSWIPRRKSNIRHGLLLITSSVLTASLASLILGSLVIGVVILSKKFNINPDNVATPIAGSLGDLTTIVLLAAISSSLFTSLEAESSSWITPLVLVCVLMLMPLWWYISHRNKYTCDVLYSGWTPVIGAMVISSLGGLILDHTIISFEGIAMFQPVINGIGGNLVAIQASRLSTALHKTSKLGVLPENSVDGCPNPCWSIFGSGAGGRSARVLLGMVIPGQVIFTLAIWLLHRAEWEPTLGFIVAYLLAALMQVAILLHTANWLVHWLWKRGMDPDNFSIPYLTAIGDLLGAVLLALAFYIQ